MRLDTVLYRKITSWASFLEVVQGSSVQVQDRKSQPKLNLIFDVLFCFVTSSHI